MFRCASRLLAKGNTAFPEGLRQSGAPRNAQIATMLALEWERMQMRGGADCIMVCSLVASGRK
jgi:hypothetical protein